MRKVFLLYFLLLTQVIFSATYIPRNMKEEKILKSYKEHQLVLGLKNTEFDNMLIDGESLNTIIEEMLRDYLNLNIRVVMDDWSSLYSSYNNKDIDILGVMNQSEDRKEKWVFSLPLYDDFVYIASSGKDKFDPNNIKSLEGKNIYVTKGSIYKDSLIKFLESKNLTVNLIEVDDSYRMKDEIYLTSKYNITGWESKIKVGYVSDTSISLRKNLKDLSLIINNALLEKYQTKIRMYLEKRENYLFKKNFLNYLTESEKNYLKKLEVINFGLVESKPLNYYSQSLNRYVGVTPFFLEKIAKKLNLKLRIIKPKNNEWRVLYEKILNKEIKVLPFLSTKKNENIIFTNTIYEPILYRISNFDKTNLKVGVVRNSVEEHFGREVYDDLDIKFYNDENSLEGALNTREVSTILLFDINKIDTSKFKVDELLRIPIALALHREDVILRDVLNKFISNSLTMEKIIEEADIIKKQEAFNQYQKFQVTNRILYILLTISGLFGIASIFKIFSNYKLTRELKKDLITGLPNRTEFLNFLSKKKNLKGYSIAMDIDNFKEINDKYGQVTGDYILKSVGQCLKRIFRNHDIFRVSGDEFDVFVQEEFIIERLNSLKDELKALKLAYQLELSIGYYKKNIDEELEDAFKYAYMAMEEAKKVNETYYVEATEELLKRKKRENSIKSLLRNKNLSGLYAVYQPKFNIKTKKVMGGESLARWSDDKLGFISPAEFIPIAENINLIHLVDYKIANETIKFVKDLKENNLVDENFKLSFNLSMKTLERSDVVRKIKEFLEKNDASGKWLELEITESIFSTNLKTTLLKIDELKKLGLSLAMDDFTAGHSTVSLLPLLPLEVVKFDKGILDAIGTKDNLVASNIYSALVGLVKDLNVAIVAEGIETEAQLLFLDNSNVKIGQGYIFSKPITKDEFKKKL
ncbi:EAL domain-containing protein [Cetobacterium sp.]|uniref:EAL domain-containing protein n=1 Tax=Cetobacterium sp. TaxID=2071632 RepID=UPI003F33DA45